MKLPSIIKPPTIYKQQLSATNKGHISASILQNLYVKIKRVITEYVHEYMSPDRLRTTGRLGTASTLQCPPNTG